MQEILHVARPIHVMWLVSCQGVHAPAKHRETQNLCCQARDEANLLLCMWMKNVGSVEVWKVQQTLLFMLMRGRLIVCDPSPISCPGVLSFTSTVLQLLTI